MTMQKALYPRDGIDRQYESGKMKEGALKII